MEFGSQQIGKWLILAGVSIALVGAMLMIFKAHRFIQIAW
jgi:hypothetical protein